MWKSVFFFFFQAEDGIRDLTVTGVQTCALPIFTRPGSQSAPSIPSEPVPPIRTNGTTEKESPAVRSGLGLVNGTEAPSSPKLQEPLRPTPSTTDRPVSGIDIAPKPATDGEGFSIPPAANDPITQAEQEAAL